MILNLQPKKVCTSVKYKQLLYTIEIYHLIKVRDFKTRQQVTLSKAFLLLLIDLQMLCRAKIIFICSVNIFRKNKCIHALKIIIKSLSFSRRMKEVARIFFLQKFYTIHLNIKIKNNF